MGSSTSFLRNLGEKNRHLPKAPWGQSTMALNLWQSVTITGPSTRTDSLMSLLKNSNTDGMDFSTLIQHFLLRKMLASSMISRFIILQGIGEKNLNLTNFRGLGANPATANGKQALLLEGRHSHKNRCVMMCQLALLLWGHFALEENIGP